MIAALFWTLAPVAVAQDLAMDPRVKQSLTFLEMWLDAQRAYEQIPGVSAAVVEVVRWNNPYPKMVAR